MRQVMTLSWTSGESLFIKQTMVHFHSKYKIFLKEHASENVFILFGFNVNNIFRYSLLLFVNGTICLQKYR